MRACRKPWFGASVLAARQPLVGGEREENVPSTVTVHTYRGSCVEFGRTDAEVIGLTATIEPYDWVRGTLCTGPVSTIAHPVQLVFAQPGTATLRFVGLDWRDSVVTIERSAPVTN